MEEVPQRSSHSTKPARAQGAFGQCSQGHGVTLGVSAQGQGLDLVILMVPF